MQELLDREGGSPECTCRPKEIAAEDSLRVSFSAQREGDAEHAHTSYKLVPKQMLPTDSLKVSFRLASCAVFSTPLSSNTSDMTKFAAKSECAHADGCHDFSEVSTQTDTMIFQKHDF